MAETNGATGAGRCFICDKSRDANANLSLSSQDKSSAENGNDGDSSSVPILEEEEEQEPPAKARHTFVLHDLLVVSSDLFDKCSGAIAIGELVASTDAWVKLCRSCTQHIDMARKCHMELIEATNRFHELRAEVIEIMRRSKRAADEVGVSGREEVVQELRNCIANAGYSDYSPQSRPNGFSHGLPDDQLQLQPIPISSFANDNNSCDATDYFLASSRNELSPITAESPFLRTIKTEPMEDPQDDIDNDNYNDNNSFQSQLEQDALNSNPGNGDDNRGNLRHEQEPGAQCPLISRDRAFGDVMLDHGLNLNIAGAASNEQPESRKELEGRALEAEEPEPGMIMMSPPKKPGRRGRPRKHPIRFLNGLSLSSTPSTSTYTSTSPPASEVGSNAEVKVKRGPGRPRKTPSASGSDTATATLVKMDLDNSASMETGFTPTQGPQVKRKRGRPPTRLMPVLMSFDEVKEELPEEVDINMQLQLQLQLQPQPAPLPGHGEVRLRSGRISRRKEPPPDFAYNERGYPSLPFGYDGPPPPLVRAKRGRGRPPRRQLVKEEPRPGPSALSIQAGTAGRGRGRGRPPRQFQVHVQFEHNHEQSDQVPEPNPNPNPGFDLSQVKIEIEDDAEADAQAEGQHQDQGFELGTFESLPQQQQQQFPWETKKRGRGRPRKNPDLG